MLPPGKASAPSSKGHKEARPAKVASRDLSLPRPHRGHSISASSTMCRTPPLLFFREPKMARSRHLLEGVTGPNDKRLHVDDSLRLIDCVIDVEDRVRPTIELQTESAMGIQRIAPGGRLGGEFFIDHAQGR